MCTVPHSKNLQFCRQSKSGSKTVVLNMESIHFWLRSCHAPSRRQNDEPCAFISSPGLKQRVRRFCRSKRFLAFVRNLRQMGTLTHKGSAKQTIFELSTRVRGFCLHGQKSRTLVRKVQTTTLSQRVATLVHFML